MNIKGLIGVSLVGIALGYLMIFKPGTDPAETALDQGAAMVTVALPVALTDQARNGKRGFDANCAKCHGENAGGQNGIAPPLIHKIYQPNHHSDVAFLLATKNGVRAHHWRFGNMPRVPGLTDAEVGDITRYIREVQKENDIF